MRFQFNPFTDKLDISGEGGTGNPVEFVTGNDGIPVTPDPTLNINIVGENVLGINATGNPVLHTLTIAGIDATTTQKGVLATSTNAQAAAQTSTANALTPSNITSLFSTSPLPTTQGGTGQTTYTDGQLLIGNSTGNTLTKNSLTAGAGITITPGSGNITIAATGVPAPNQQQIYYVGKNGNDFNSGLNIENSKLTITAAITAAGLLTPSAVNRFAIVILDDGIYTENISPPSFVDVFAPNAKLVGNITAADDSFVKFRAQSVATGDTGVSKFGGAGTFYIEVEEIDCAGTGGWLVSTSGIVQAQWKKLTVVDGSGIGDLTSALGHIHVKGGDVYISGTGNAIARANAGSTVGHIDHIIDIGGGNGTGIAINTGEFDLIIQSLQSLANGIFVSGGTCNLSVQNINCTAAYGVIGGTLSLIYNNLSGTRSNVGGTVKTWCTITEGTAGQIAQSAGANASPVFSTATYPSTTAQGDLLLSATANTITALNKNTTATRYLANTGVNNNAQWDQVNATNGISGTTDHTLQIGNATGSLTSLGVATNGQLPIGSTGADPVLALPSNGNNITWTGGAGTLTANLTGTTNHNIQIGNAGGSLTSLGSATNGQLPIGSTGADPVLATLASADSSISVTNGAGTIDLSGRAIQSVQSQITSVVTINAGWAFDDSIPQKTEGVEVTTVTITPKNSNNILLIKAHAWGMVTTGVNGSIALFQDATNDALAAVHCPYANGAGWTLAGTLMYKMTAGTTSATTFKLRASATPSTWYVNGDNTSARLYGGVGTTYLEVIELRA